MANLLLSANTTTPRPPLNVFEASRAVISGNNWVTLAEVPQYYIPSNGPIAAKTINAVAIMTGLTVTNLHTGSITVSARIVGQAGELFPVLNEAVVPANDFLIISFDRQVMMTWEKLEVSTPSNQTLNNHACAHFTYIVNQREEFNLLDSKPRP